MRALVWFRSDLRTDDQPALAAACAAATRGVIAVFVVTPAQWRAHDWADVKVDFVLRNLAALRTALAELRIPLLIRTAADFAATPATLVDVAARCQCDALFFNREYEVNEQRRDAAVEREFAAVGRAVQAFHDQTLVPPGVLRTQSGGAPRVFTPFRRTWLAWLADHPDRLTPAPAPRPQPEAPRRADELPSGGAGFAAPEIDRAAWPAGEAAARARLHEFLGARLRGYKTGRDEPGYDGTSRLSPYLALGVLSARRCFVEARAANGGRLDGGGAGPDTWISELAWREFYRHLLVAYPRVSMGRAFLPAGERVRWRDAADEFAAWTQGRTGYPIVDAGLRQLAATGWMHNRVRMITAMFLTKHLLISWRRGEQHFMRRLIDGDLASNNGGWQWCASTGADAVPYFRIFNPYLQSQRFDPHGVYIRAWVPELATAPAPALHDVNGVAAEVRRRTGYPAPLVAHAAARRRALGAFAVLGARGRGADGL